MRTLKKGDSGQNVRSLQLTLIQLEYDLGKWGADGIFGDQTKEAVKQFQKHHSLGTSGIVDQATREALFYSKMFPENHTVSAHNAAYQKVRNFESLKPTKQERQEKSDESYHYYTRGKTHIVEVEPMQLKISPYYDRMGHNFPEKNYMTAAFLGHHPDKSTFPTSMLVSEGKIINNTQPNGLYEGIHAGKGMPTPTFIVTKDNKVKIEIQNDIRNFPETWFAVSGLQVLPFTQTGFPPALVKSVTYKTHRVGIAYHPAKHKVFLVYMPGINAQDFGKLFETLGCSFGLTLDSGGSSVLRVAGLIRKNTSRRIPNIITW